jgi:flavin reductase (DIM6/NTAB) family NADH-FMN oxidoreductase RutF
MSDETYHLQQTKIVAGKEIAALLNPRPVVLVTCCEATGVPNILSVAWHTPLSHDPPMVGISIGLTRHSHALISNTGEFVVNVVSRDLQPAVELCGNLSGRDNDKVALSGLHLRPARYVRSPVISDALGHLECRVVQQTPAGDHTFFVAQVLHAEARADRFTDSWHPNRSDVLLCWQRDRFGYGCFEEEKSNEY